MKTINTYIQKVDFTSSDWSAKELDEVRKYIKDHYLDQQDHRCCYCNQEILSEHGRIWDVEHVISRSRDSRFMFEPANLAVSCIECNTSKDAIDVTKKKYSKFPSKSEQYLIVHPHFDNFDDHIETEGDYTYHALSEKGKFTIYHCDLFRYRARQAKIRRPIRDRRFERDVGELRFVKSPEEAGPIIASILARLEIEKKNE